MKNKKQNTAKLEIAIVIALLVLAVVIIMALKINQRKLPLKEPVMGKVEEREVVSIKKLPVTIPKTKIQKEVDREKVTKYQEKKLKKEQDDYIETLRQKQMQKLRKDLKELTVEKEKEDISPEETPAATTKHSIHPREEDIRKMEKEKAVLY